MTLLNTKLKIMTWDSMYAEQNGLVKQTSKSNSQQDLLNTKLKIMTWDSMVCRTKRSS